jgi:hypothetical protein
MFISQDPGQGDLGKRNYFIFIISILSLFLEQDYHLENISMTGKNARSTFPTEIIFADINRT